MAEILPMRRKILFNLSIYLSKNTHHDQHRLSKRKENHIISESSVIKVIFQSFQTIILNNKISSSVQFCLS